MIDKLVDARACPHETALFREMFGDGDECTLERCLQAAPHFDWIFASRRLLTAKQYAHFRALIVAATRQLKRVADKGGEKRRRAYAQAFFQAFNGPEE